MAQMEKGEAREMAERGGADQTKADQEQAIAKGVGRSAARGEKLKKELDDLLDEVDDVLETNAEDFVKAYVQKGGE